MRRASSRTAARVGSSDASTLSRSNGSVFDGLTVTSRDWWLNVRPSNTEPLLRLNVEASDEPTLAAVRDEALRIVRGGYRPPRTRETP